MVVVVLVRNSAVVVGAVTLQNRASVRNTQSDTSSNTRTFLPRLTPIAHDKHAFSMVSQGSIIMLQLRSSLVSNSFWLNLFRFCFIAPSFTWHNRHLPVHPFLLLCACVYVFYECIHKLLHYCHIVATLLLHCCYTVATVATLLLHSCYMCLLHSGYTVATLLLHCCYTVVTLLLHCCYTVATLLLHCCYTVVTLLLHCCYTVVTLLLHCCYTVATLLLHCCYMCFRLLLHLSSLITLFLNHEVSEGVTVMS
jgi:hypothetical protein